MTTPVRTLPLAFRRFRRLRRSEALRALVRETRLSPGDFVYPLFVTHGEGVRSEISSMPGQYHLSLDQLRRETDELRSLGIPAVLLFGLPAAKDEAGSEAYDPEGIVQRAVRTLKHAWPELVVITDVCLCEYTIARALRGREVGLSRATELEVDNDATLPLLARTAVSHVEAGADIVAPSDMMDGRVAQIRVGARRQRLRADADHGVRGEAGVGVLRAVPRGGGVGAAVRGPSRVPDGRGEQPRSDAGDRGGHRGGGGHRDGEAGAAEPGPDRAGAGAVRRAAGGVQRERGVRDGEGGGSGGVPGRAVGDAGDTDGDHGGRGRTSF